VFFFPGLIGACPLTRSCSPTLAQKLKSWTCDSLIFVKTGISWNEGGLGFFFSFASFFYS
jgi:hypothetical protein